MTQEDIIRMAREVGVETLFYSGRVLMGDDDIKNIYALAYAAGAAAENEACAKVCDAESIPQHGEIHSDAQWSAKVLAGKIRARGQA